VTDNDTDIMPETKVEVVAIINGDCLVVCPIVEE